MKKCENNKTITHLKGYASAYNAEILNTFTGLKLM